MASVGAKSARARSERRREKIGLIRVGVYTKETILKEWVRVFCFTRPHNGIKQ